MSDLAPLVAATLRDKIVADLQEENRRLRQSLGNSTMVSLVHTQAEDDCRATAFASTRFEEGQFGTCPCWWKITYYGARPLPLSRLPSLELRLGENSFVSVANDCCEGFAAMEEEFGEETRMVNLYLRKCWVSISVEGLCDEAWEALQDGVPSSIMTDMARVRDPGVFFTVHHVTFKYSKVKGLMQSLGLDPVAEDARRKQQGCRDISVEVMLRLREYFGNYMEPPPAELMEKHSELMHALGMMGMSTVNQRFHSVIESLIRAQYENREGFTKMVSEVIENSTGRMEIDPDKNVEFPFCF